MNPTVCIDLDGTMSQFYADPNCLERMWEPGYFRKLAPYQVTVEAVKQLARLPIELFILSSITTEYEANEKLEWLDENLHGVFDYEHIMFIAPTTPKWEVFAKKYGTVQGVILVDDYNKNLELWHAHGGKAIKFVNEINDKGKSGPLWSGERVRYTDAPSDIVNAIMTVATTKQKVAKATVTWEMTAEVEVILPPMVKDEATFIKETVAKMRCPADGTVASGLKMSSFSIVDEH